MKIVLIILSALALLGGAYLASLVFKKEEIQKSAASVHGIVAFLLILSVAYFAYDQGRFILWACLGLLIITSFGGMYLDSNRRKSIDIPRSAVWIHMIFAISSVGALLFTIFF